MKKHETDETDGKNGNEDAPAARVSVRDGRTFVDITRVRPDPGQPRKTFDPDKLKELADSIGQVGVLQDLLVKRVPAWTLVAPDLARTEWTVLDQDHKEISRQPSEILARCDMQGREVETFLILDGERRWKAAMLAGLTEVPIAERSVEDDRRVIAQVVLNQQREGLSAFEEAEAFKSEMEKGHYTAESLAKALGVSRSTVFNRLSLTRLRSEVKDAVLAGQISVSVAGLVAMIPDFKGQQQLLKRLVNEKDYNYPWSFRRVQQQIETDHQINLKGAKFDLEASYRFPMGVERGNPSKDPEFCGPCSTCPHRTGNMKETFPDFKGSPDLCTLTGCFKRKERVCLELAWEAAHKKHGERLLPLDTGLGLFDQWNPEEVAWKIAWTENLDVRCNRDELSRDYKALLGKKAPKPEVAVCPTGKVIAVWSFEKLDAAVEAAGVKLDAKTEPGAEPAQTSKEDIAKLRKKEEEARAETLRLHKMREELAPKALGLAMERIEKLNTEGTTEKDFWRFAIRQVADITEDWKMVADRRGLKAAKLEQVLAKLDLRQARSFFFEMLAVDAQGDGIVDWNGGWGSQFEAVCEFAGVNLKELEKAAGEQKETKETKKKGKK